MPTETIGFVRNNKIARTLSKSMQKKLDSARNRLWRGQEYRQNKREESWRRSYSQYMDELGWGNAEDPTADLVSVNVSFSTMNTLLPFVSDENPSFVVSPSSKESTVENAALLQSFMNRFWRSPDLQGTVHFQEAVFDDLLYGDGYVKVGYEIKELDVFDSIGDKVPNRTEVAKFKVSRINPWDVWIDPYSDGIYNARWVCQRIILPRRELEVDDRYRMKKDTNVGSIENDFQSAEDQERLNLMEDWVTIYEFYDLVENWMIAFPADANQAIRYIEQIVPPIIQLPNYRIPNSPYHLSDLEMVYSLQLELNKTRSQMITHRRRNVVKWMVRDQTVTPEMEEAMRSSKLNDVISVPSNEPFDEILQQIVAAPLSPDMYLIDDRIRADINDVTGVNDFLRGAPQSGSRTATEATIVEGATNTRTRHKLLQIETAARQVGQLLLDIIRDVLPLTDFEEMSMFITGREAERLNRAAGEEDFKTDLVITPTPEVFEGRYEVNVERGSTELRNPELKAQKLGNMVVSMLSAAPTLLQLGIPLNIQLLMEMWFKAEGIEDVDSLFQPEEAQQFAQEMSFQQQENEAAGDQPGTPPGAPPGDVVGGGRTPQGQPRPETTGPPTQRIDEGNSGILPPRG